MMIVAHDAPDFRTIADFRKRHLPALGRLFLQVLKLAEKAGLAKLGHVALDGTKIKANASKHKAMSYERMKTRETELRAEVDRWLEAAASSRRARGQTPRRKPSRRRNARLDRRQAEALWPKSARPRRLEAEAAAAAAAKAEAERAAEEKREAENRKRSAGRFLAALKSARSQGAAQLHRSRQPHPPDQGRLHPGLQRASGGRRGAQIIVAHGPRRSSMQRLSATCSRWSMPSRPTSAASPREISADAGYCTEDNLSALASRQIHAYIATGRAKHPAETTRKRRRDDAEDAPEAEARRPSQPLPIAKAGRRAGVRADQASTRIPQFLLRGLDKVKAEWALICTAHNILKLAKAAA